MLSKIDRISDDPVRYRVTCECGRFTHEIFSDDAGEKLRMETYSIRKPDDEPDEAKAVITPKKKGFSTLFNPPKGGK